MRKVHPNHIRAHRISLSQAAAFTAGRMRALLWLNGMPLPESIEASGHVPVVLSASADTAIHVFSATIVGITDVRLEVSVRTGIVRFFLDEVETPLREMYAMLGMETFHDLDAAFIACRRNPRHGVYQLATIVPEEFQHALPQHLRKRVFRIRHAGRN